MVKFRIIAKRSDKNKDSWEAICLETGDKIKGYGQTKEQAADNLVTLLKERIIIETKIPFTKGVLLSQSAYWLSNPIIKLKHCRQVRHYFLKKISWQIIYLYQHIHPLKNLWHQELIDFRGLKIRYSP